MMRSMFSGVSGLRNHQIEMDAIGNNIANVNTVGYKGSRVSFQDTLNQTLRGASAPNGNRGGINALQVGLGMNLASIDVFQTQGNLQNTGKITDMAIQGDGFFVLGDGQRQFFTRSGAFNMDENGRLVGPSNGLIAQGWMADVDGVINNNGPIGSIQLPLGKTIAPIATTTIQYGSNLNALTNGNLSYGKSTVITDASNPQKKASIELQLVPNGYNTFRYTAKITGGDVTTGTGTGTIVLNEEGNITNIIQDGGGNYFDVTPTGGQPVRIQLPTTGSIDGGFFIVNPTGLNQNFSLFGTPPVPGTYTQRLLDQTGNPVDLTYTLTQNANHFRWSLTVTGGTLQSGSTGTFDYDTTGLVSSNVSDGNTVIRSNSGNNLTINPPIAGPGPISFTVVEQAPRGVQLPSGTESVPFTNFHGADTYTSTVMDSTGRVVHLTYTVAATVGNQYSWTLTIPPGEITAAPAGDVTGTFSWTQFGGVTSPSGTAPTTFTPVGGGSLITINLMTPPLASPSFGVTLAAPGTSPIPINGSSTMTFTDANGDPVSVRFDFSGTGPNYNWTATGIGGATVISGGSGSFNWTGPDVTGPGVRSASPGSIQIQSANGMLVTVNQPLNTPVPVPAAGNRPIFQQAPGTSLLGTFKTPPDVVTTTKVYDSIGTEHIITTTVHKMGTNQWSWVASEGNGLPIQNGTGILTFDTVTGFVTNMPGGTMSFTPADANPVLVTPDFSKVTQGSEKIFSNDDYQWPQSTFNSPYQDGYPMGMLQGYNIDKSGRVIGVFSNGMNQNLAQLAVATFTNPGGLTRSGDTLFEESSNSGTALIGQAGMGGRGLITPGAVEMSNVDLSQEFTNMIVTERGFQANSKIITTTDEMLQELVNLKR